LKRLETILKRPLNSLLKSLEGFEKYVEKAFKRLSEGL
jgi:hypothetical protein